MKKISFKNIIPYLSGIILFIVITFAYMSPMLEGKKVQANDIKQWEGAAKEVRDFKQETGQYSQWTGSSFSGMPTYQISSGAQGNKIRYIRNIIELGLPYPASSMFIYFLGFFVLLLVLRVNPWLSIVGAIAFGFSSYFFVLFEAGHVTKTVAIGYMPFVVAGIILIYQKKHLLGTAFTALFAAIQISANHPQITYYMGLCLVIFGIVEFISIFKTKEWKPFLISTSCVIIATLIGLGVNTNILLPTQEYSKDTIRGKSELTSNHEDRTSGLDIEYATQWSYGKAETFTLMIPDFMGGANQRVPGDNSHVYKDCIENRVSASQAKQIANSLPMYWGPQPFTSGPVYAGAIVCFLFILGLFLVKGKWKWWLLSATILSILLAWGKNFMPFTEFFMHYMPGYNKFRTVSMTLVIAEFTMPLLGFLALKNIWDGTVDKEKTLKGMQWSLIITGGLCLVFILFKNMFFDFSTPQDASYGLPDWLIGSLQDDRSAMLTKDSMRSLIFILLTAAVLFFYQKNKINKTALVAALGVFILIDMWAIDKRYFNNDNFVSQSKIQNQFTKTPADIQILEDKDPNFRVFNQTVSPFNDASTSYYHKSIGGYHGAKLRRYQDVIDSLLSNGNMNAFNMLNTKYFIVKGEDGAPKAVQNPNALGNAWFIEDLKIVENADQEIVAMKDVDPAKTAIVDQRFNSQLEGFTFQKDSLATIAFEEYRPNYLRYKTHATTPNMVVFSEVYYEKGWNAYIDGVHAPHFRADYILRAMIVPAGDHSIEFKFEPETFYKAEKASFAFSIIVYLLLFSTIGYQIFEAVKKNKLKKKE